ncbi:MAG: exo-alpha-sialidase [Alphaproteobacteria bacterium]|nr:exo-alpha-sialidase [Alphaproteobacteria bacterium]
MRNILHAAMVAGVVSLFTGGAAGAAHDHGSTDSGKAPPSGFDACQTGTTDPSMRCSPVVTPAAGRDGRIWLAWVDGGHVYVNHSDDAGQSQSTPIRINATPAALDINGENRPKAIPAPNGDIYVSYTAKGERKFTGVVWFSRSLDGGKSFSEPVRITDEAVSSSQRFETMRVDPEGRIYIAWLDKRDLFAAKQTKQPYIGSAIYYTRSDDRGASFTANRPIFEHTCECCRVAMAMDDEGLPVIVWRNIFGADTRDHAVVRFLDPDKPAAVTRLSNDEWHIEACPHHGPAMAIGPDGAYHVVWYTDGDNRNGLFHARSEDRGKSFSTPVGFGNPNRMPAHPDIAILGNRLFVAWKEFNGEQSELYVMSSPDSGRSWSTPMRVAATDDESDHPLFVDDGQWLHLSWQTAAVGWLLQRIAGH